MRNILTVCEKELKSYFYSPIAYFFLLLFALVFGFFFWNYVGGFAVFSVRAQMSGRPVPMNLNEQVVQPLLSLASLLGLFLTPLITMRLFAEEKRTGTIELLVTSPIKDVELVVGKWLAAVILYCCLLLVVALNFSFLFLYGNPDWKPIAVGFLGLLLQAGSFLALGTFLSTVTRNQIIAAGATFSLSLLLWVFNAPASYETARWAQIMGYLSVLAHYEPFSRGVIDSKDVVFFASLIFFGLFLSTRSLESMRWRS